MAPANRPDFHPSGRLDRAIRTVLIACFAALIGVIAGGASVFAIVSALTSPPRRDVSADAAPRESQTGRVQTEPARVVPEPPSGLAATTAPSMQTQAPAQATPPAASQAQASSPNLQTPSSAPAAPRDQMHAMAPVEQPAPGTQTEEANKGGGNEINRTNSHAQSDSRHSASGTEGRTLSTRPRPSARSTRNMEPEQRRDIVTLRPEPQTNVEAAEVPRDHARPLFDFFGDANGSGGPDTANVPEASAPPAVQRPKADSREKGEATKSHVVRRCRRNDDMEVGQVPQRRVIVVPARPEYSYRQSDDRQGGFFGLFDRGD